MGRASGFFTRRLSAKGRRGDRGDRGGTKNNNNGEQQGKSNRSNSTSSGDGGGGGGGTGSTGGELRRRKMRDWKETKCSMSVEESSGASAVSPQPGSSIDEADLELSSSAPSDEKVTVSVNPPSSSSLAKGIKKKANRLKNVL